MSLEALARAFSSDCTSVFVAMLPTLIEQLDSVETLELTSSLWICIGTFVSELKAHTLPYLPRLLPLLCTRLSQVDEADEDGTVLALSTVGTAVVLVEALPQFMSSHLGALLRGVLMPHNCDSQSEELRALVQRILKAISSISIRLLLPAACVVYDSISPSNTGSRAKLLGTLEASLLNMSEDEIEAHYKKIFQFALSALEGRYYALLTIGVEGSVTAFSADVERAIHTLESHAISLLLELVKVTALRSHCAQTSAVVRVSTQR